MVTGTVVAIRFDSPGKAGMFWRVLLHIWQKDAAILAIRSENPLSIQFELENITDHILPGLR